MLNHLRQRRWVWAFALFALSFKLVAGTICLGDPVAGQHAGAIPVQTQGAGVTASIAAADEAACLLGEAVCHCSCAETLPIPATVVASLGAATPEFVAPQVAATFVPIAIESQLRPPIA